MIEQWKNIQNFDGYQVSNQGRVKSLARKVLDSENRWQQVHERILKEDVRDGGYRRVTLSIKGKTTRFSVHRLVGSYFIPNPENKKTINHIDGKPWNNMVSNLEWNTQSENQLHAYRTKLQLPVKGEAHGNHKLKEVDIVEIRRLYDFTNEDSTSIARAFNVKVSTISAILRNEQRVDANYSPKILDEKFRHLKKRKFRYIYKDVQDLSSKGVSNTRLSDIFHINMRQVRSILTSPLYQQ